MKIVIYRKSDGKLKSLMTLPEDHNPVDYEDDIHAVLEVEELPNLESKVINGQVLPIEVGDYPEENEEKAWQELRQLRHHLLDSSDWTQLNDNPRKSMPAWINYRKELRDITEQPNAPYGVVWPIKPID